MTDVTDPTEPIAEETKKQIHDLLKSRIMPIIDGRIEINDQKAFIDKQKADLAVSEARLLSLEQDENKNVGSLLELAKLAEVGLHRGDPLQTLYSKLGVSEDLTEKQADAAQAIVHHITGRAWRG